MSVWLFFLALAAAQGGFQLGKRALQKKDEKDPGMEAFAYFPISAYRELLGKTRVECTPAADGKAAVQVMKNLASLAVADNLGDDPDGFWYQVFMALFWPVKFAVNIPAYLLLGPPMAVRRISRRLERRALRLERQRLLEAQRLEDLERPDEEVRRLLGDAPERQPQLPPGGAASRNGHGRPPAELHLDTLPSVVVAELDGVSGALQASSSAGDPIGDPPIDE